MTDNPWKITLNPNLKSEILKSAGEKLSAATAPVKVVIVEAQKGHSYFAVKCVKCEIHILWRDLGPSQPGWIAELETSVDTLPVSCPECGVTHTYNRGRIVQVYY